MRVVDLQMSVNGSLPAGSETASLHAVQGYRFFKDVDQARRLNLHRQESVVAANPSTPSLLVQESVPSPARTYVNRARKETEGNRKGEDEHPAGRYESMGMRQANVGVVRGREIDFLA